MARLHVHGRKRLVLINGKCRRAYMADGAILTRYGSYGWKLAGRMAEGATYRGIAEKRMRAGWSLDTSVHGAILPPAGETFDRMQAARYQ